MANWPPVDPNDLSSASNDDLVNKATGFNYEPGSTFKAFTVAAALQEKLVTPHLEFTLAPTIQVADRTIEDSHPRGTETMSVATILAHSSNVGAVTIGDQIGAEHFDNWIHRFGFGRPTGVEFPAEEQGIVLPLDEYSGSTMGNLPIGQGISVTPMQMMAGYAAIANGGILEQPQLIKRIGDEALAIPEGKRVMRPEVAAQVREMLEGVLAPGRNRLGGQRPRLHAWRGRPEPPRWPKTGPTRRPISSPPSSASRRRAIRSFLAAVIVDQPQGDYYGGSVAAPAFGSIAGFALPYLGVAPE